MALHVPFGLKGEAVTHVTQAGVETAITTASGGVIWINKGKEPADNSSGEDHVARALMLVQESTLTSLSITLDEDDMIVRNSETWSIETIPPAAEGYYKLPLKLVEVKERSRQGYRFRR